MTVSVTMSLQAVSAAEKYTPVRQVRCNVVQTPRAPLDEQLLEPRRRVLGQLKGCCNQHSAVGSRRRPGRYLTVFLNVAALMMASPCSA